MGEHLIHPVKIDFAPYNSILNPVSQHLYRADLKAVVNGIISDEQSVRFGIREAETYINQDGWRGYKINGKKILIRGGAWMTSDMMLNLDQAYREMIAAYTPKRSYQPHSGAFHIEDRFKTGGTRTGTLELWTYANPAHYYTHKANGAWRFAQSGGIGGIFAPMESMRRMMPEQAIWPPFNACATHFVRAMHAMLNLYQLLAYI